MHKSLLILMLLGLFWSCNSDNFTYNPDSPQNFHTLTIATTDLDNATIMSIDKNDTSNPMAITHMVISVSDKDGNILFTDKEVTIKITHFADYVQIYADLAKQLSLKNNEYVITKVILIHKAGKTVMPLYVVPKKGSAMAASIPDNRLVDKALIKNIKGYTMGQLKPILYNDSLNPKDFGYDYFLDLPCTNIYVGDVTLTTPKEFQDFINKRYCGVQGKLKIVLNKDTKSFTFPDLEKVINLYIESQGGIDIMYKFPKLTSINGLVILGGFGSINDFNKVEKLNYLVINKVLQNTIPPANSYYSIKGFYNLKKMGGYNESPWLVLDDEDRYFHTPGSLFYGYEGHINDIDTLVIMPNLEELNGDIFLLYAPGMKIEKTTYMSFPKLKKVSNFFANLYFFDKNPDGVFPSLEEIEDQVLIQNNSLTGSNYYDNYAYKKYNILKNLKKAKTIWIMGNLYYKNEDVHINIFENLESIDEVVVDVLDIHKLTGFQKVKSLKSIKASFYNTIIEEFFPTLTSIDNLSVRNIGYFFTCKPLNYSSYKNTMFGSLKVVNSNLKLESLHAKNDWLKGIEKVNGNLTLNEVYVGENGYCQFNPMIWKNRTAQNTSLVNNYISANPSQCYVSYEYSKVDLPYLQSGKCEEPK